MYTAVFKQITRSAVALAAAFAAASSMAATATVLLDAPLMSANGVTATAVGANTYTAATGSLLATIDAANTSGNVVDFGNADGFKLAFDIFGLPQTATFSNFSFNTATGVLSGNLLGTGVIAGVLNYANGSLLTAGSLQQVNGSLVASGFTVAAGLEAYLVTKNINPTQLAAVTSVLKSVTVPVAVPAVPEPSTYALMGLGLVGMALVARKKSQA